MIQWRDPEDAAGLRKMAEEILAERHAEAGDGAGTQSDLRRSIHELQVHQIELEIQNQELMEMRVELEGALENFRELYDYAPVGYYSLTAEADIRQVNRTGAAMLGRDRAVLEGGHFLQFIGGQDQAIFRNMLAGVFATRTPASCEVMLHPGTSTPLRVKISAELSPTGQFCRVVATDVMDIYRLAEKFRLVAENTYDWEFWVSPEGRMLYVSPSCERITGYHHREFEDDPGLLEHILHPEDAPAFMQHHHPSMMAGPPFLSEFRIIHRDGSVRWVGHTCQAVFAEDGTFLGRRASNREITDRKATEAELLNTQTQFQAIIEKSPVACYLYQIREDGRVIFTSANPASQRITGVAPADLVGLTVEEAFPNVRGTDVPTLYRRVALGECGPQSFETYYADDRIHGFFDVHVFRIGDGQVAVKFMDITGRKRAEEETLQRTMEFNEAQRLAHVGSWDLDLRTRVLAWSDELYRIFGRDPALGPPDESEHERMIRPDSLREMKMAAEEILRHGTSYQLVLEIIRPDGDIRWVNSRGEAVRGDGGEVIRLRGTGQDITERKLAEESARAAAEQVMAAKEAAESASKAKDQFLAVLSHELRTPLTPVLMTAAALENDLTLSAETREDMAMIRRNIELETRLIDDLLDLNRINVGKFAMHSGPVELNSVVRDVCRMCRPEITGKRIYLELETAPAPLQVHGDRARLQQAVGNLLKNAGKFTPEGGRIRVKVGRDFNGGATVRIEDNGIGIAPTEMPRIFEAFHQGGARITRRFGGLGLGLALTRAIVESHGGKIEAESRGTGYGCVFKLTLPVDHQPSTPVPPVTPPAAGPGGARLRLLVVEDDADTAAILVRLLTGVGYEVTKQTSMAGAVAAVSREHFDLMISDIGLPDGTGYEMLRAVRAVQAIPAIAMSGYGMTADVAKSLEAGFAEHLTKPVNFSSLHAALRRLEAWRTHGPAS